MNSLYYSSGRSEDAVGACLAALEDDSAHVRLAAVRILCDVMDHGNSQCRQALVKKLADGADAVRQAAVQALQAILRSSTEGRIPNDDVLGEMAALVQHHRDHAVRAAALTALPSALPKHMRDASGQTKHHDGSSVVRQQLQDILVRILANPDDEMQTLVSRTTVDCELG
jgi:hypothetical protein